MRAPLLEDAPAIFEQYAQDREVTKFLLWRTHESVDETVIFLKRCQALWSEGLVFSWIILRKQDHQLMGFILLILNEHRAEIGFLLAKPYWRHGYMTEAVKAVVDWALAQETIYRVSAHCDLENVMSCRLLEKVGMQLEGVLRKYDVYPALSDEPRDTYCYAIVK